MLDIHDILGPDGLVAQHLNQYESRPQQLAMAEAVHSALTGERHVVVEAGTGVGKSFAYLVPAILASSKQRGENGAPVPEPKRVVISTHTISLQEQLMSKDLPLLRDVFPKAFSAVLVKGRGNYLSRRRLRNAMNRAGHLFGTHQELDQLRDLTAWQNETEEGSRSDLEYQPLPQVWDEVASDSGNCLGRKCATHAECFYFRARRSMQKAGILVVNHALLFSDLALRKEGVGFLPDYDAVIFDEAHTVDEVAAEHLGIGLTSGQVDYTLNKLYNDRNNKGLLVTLKARRVQEQVVRCRTHAENFFYDLADWLAAHPQGNGRVREPGILENTLSGELDTLAKQVRIEGGKVEDESQRQDFISASNRLNGLADELDRWLTHEMSDAVYWIEHTPARRGRRLRVRLAAAPIDVGPVLKETLYKKVPSLVFTSATLSIGRSGSFDYFTSRLGLEETETAKLGSPFDYRRQAEIVLLRDMPDPSSGQQYEQLTAKMIRRYVARSDGHAFALFTSYAMMKRVADDLRDWLADNSLDLYCQADGLPRHQMIERFKRNPRALLMGTVSFWQGVDVPGDALTNVIITKLPFSVPDQPLLEARLERIREKGGNPFMDYQLPEAIIRLRQGFGRLIRTQQDQGMVVILDPRVRTKRYGRLFLDSLPECEVIEESVEG